MIRSLIFATSAMLAAQAALAQDYRSQMLSYLEDEIMPWASESVLIDAVRAQNDMTAAYSQADIDALDAAWREEIGMSDRPTIDPVLENAASAFLRDRVAAAGGAITEVFIMDARGLNVAASDVTSDYWQGDEAKFSETFPNGAGASHISEVEYDESTQTYQAQISFPIVDPVSNEVVGAATVGVNADALF